MPFNVQEIRSQLALGGARPSQFQVRITNPTNSAGDVKVPFLCQAAVIPSSTLGQIAVPYFGRKIQLAGDRTFEPWTVTILNDEDFLIRNAMEEWSNKINTYQTNLIDFGTAAPLQYKSQAQIIQYSKAGVPIREYTLNGVWPSEVASIDMNWDTTDTIETFTVTFQYDWHYVSGGVTGNAGGA